MMRSAKIYALAPPPEIPTLLQWRGPVGIPRGNRRAAGRGLYRVFNAAAYRFYRSSVGPPAESDVPYATSAALPDQPASTFADGTWYVSVSYFNGVLDSGFLPVGPRGETYLVLEIASGAAVTGRPGGALGGQLVQRAGGVVRVVAYYLPAADGANAATTWAIGYTLDGSTPAAGAPTAVAAMSGGDGLKILAFDLPAQVAGTMVKVQLQTRRAGTPIVYSLPAAVLSLTVATAGPAAPLGLQSWAGAIPEDL